MGTVEVSSFQKALDAIESLPETQREHLVEVVRHRMIDARRAELARSVREAKSDYRAGRVRKGSTADLLRELRSCAG